MRLRVDQAVVVTGAGSGIGYAIARALATRGCRVVLVDNRGDRLAVAERELAALAPAVSVHEADVSDAAAVIELAAQVEHLHGSANLLVNCAGVAASGPFVQSSAKDFEWVMNVNFSGTVLCCRAFLPLMLAGREGHIVNISSCFGLLGFPGKSAYSASKFAVRGFSESLRAELRGTGVGVTVVYPGPVDTNLARDGRDVDEASKAREVRFLAQRAISSDRVANAVIRGVEGDKARVIVGVDYRLIDLIVRLAPTWAQAMSARFGRPAVD